MVVLSEWATGTIYLDSNGDRQPEYWLLDLNGRNEFHRALSTSIALTNGALETVRLA